MVYRVGLIRVVTLDDENILNLHGRVIEKIFPELRVVSRCIWDQPRGIYDRESEEVAKPKILQLAREFERDGVDAIIVSCAADPAVEEARRILRIPVIGAGSSAAGLALSYGRRVAVLNLTEDTPEVIRRILGEHLVAEDRPIGVRNTIDLMSGWGREAAREALKRISEKSIDVIVLGCTGYTTIGFASTAREIVRVPVIDPVVAAGAATLHILKSSLG
ncbi:MAG: aspartate/glutamate racemase family protein [Ignisphaera sp.]|uniref:Hydantoin racemase n=1 Tax=Ignisphaera aggregans TaxID=334771 RepID=A0A7J3I9B5_9CREN